MFDGGIVGRRSITADFLCAGLLMSVVDALYDLGEVRHGGRGLSCNRNLHEISKTVTAKVNAGVSQGIEFNCRVCSCWTRS